MNANESHIEIPIFVFQIGKNSKIRWHCWQGFGKRNSNLLLVKMQNDMSLEGSLAISIKLHVYFLCDPAVSLLRPLFYTEVSFHVCIAGITYTAFYCTSVVKKIFGYNQCPSKRDLFKNKQTKTCVFQCIHTVEYYAA